MRFYLGTHETSWLGRTDVALFISHRRLRKRKSLPRARGRWVLDSGGFSEIAEHGRWTESPAHYATAVRRYRDEIGGLDWAAPQDWMCEPHMIAKTGLSVAEHQERTVDNLLELRGIAPDLPWAPVLQGWELPDYLACADLYAAAGVDLAAEPIVGVGSVCRRQSGDEIGEIMSALEGMGLRLHGFGVKIRGLANYGAHLASSDSMAWSFDARRAEPLPGHPHINCANCIDWALAWREKVLWASS